eukprot:Clim_evm3s100 gene=Clim_evmTU3s100
MNFKIAALAAAAAVASADPFDGNAPQGIPQILRDALAQNQEAFASEEARQKFLAGEADGVKASNWYFGTQTTFGDGDCTDAYKVNWMSVFCAAYKLEGENNEVVLYDDFEVGGHIEFAEDKIVEIDYKPSGNNNGWEWNFKERTVKLEGKQDFKFVIRVKDAEDNTTTIYDETKNWHDPLFAYQLQGGWILARQRAFWYRYGPKPMEDSEDLNMWCALLAQPKCEGI